ncbi:MAG: transposase, partial [Cyclobacteriaceae bacterium]
MAKYQGKYRIGSARLAGYDYGAAGMYFVTICTKDRMHYFGEIVTDPQGINDAAMQLNDIGRIVEEEWIKTPDIRPDMHLTLGEFVVMPNHFHAIIIIGNNPYNMNNDGGGRIAMHR